MESHQLVTIEDMLLFCLSEAQYLMKIYNGQQTYHTNKFGMYVQKNLSSFIYWLHDLQKSQETILYTLWMQPQLVMSMLRQSLPSLYQCGKYQCWMGIGLLEGEIYHKYGE